MQLHQPLSRHNYENITPNAQHFKLGEILESVICKSREPILAENTARGGGLIVGPRI